MEKCFLLRCGALFDGVTEELKKDMEILVEGERIKAVGRALEVPEGAEEIDLTGLTVTPGLIDAHIHTTIFDWHNIYPETLGTTGMKTLASLHCAQRTLHRGFTSIRDVGTFTMAEGYGGMGALDAKRAIAMGYFEGSRMVVAPMFLCTPGSHGDGSMYYAKNPMVAHMVQQMAPNIGSGRDFFVNAVREQAKYGADFIKIMATGGFFSPNDTPVQQQLTDDELEAIIYTAKELGLTVTAHAYTPQLVQKLAKLGIDGVEHAALIDEETARLLEEKNVYVVPTFLPYDEIIHMDEAALAKKQPIMRRKLMEYAEQLKKGREVIKNSRIRLGYGTDIVSVHDFYDSGYEYRAWLNSGMDPFRALKAATSVNAEILQLPEVGTLKEGMLADIAAWKGDLLHDPDALLDCAFVMKGGVRYATEPCGA